MPQLTPAPCPMTRRGRSRCRRRRAPAGRAARRSAGAAAAPAGWPSAKAMAKWKLAALARTRSSTQMRPPISSTSWAQMVRPRPVPPKRRLRRGVGLDEGDRRSATACSGAMPMPVSGTVKRSARLAVARRARTRRRRTTSPASVNLIALPTQVEDHLAQPAGVADQRVGDVGADAAGQLEALLVGPQPAISFTASSTVVAQAERAAIEHHPAGLDLRHVEDVVEDLQQRLGRLVGGLDELALRRRQPGLQRQRGHADHRVHRRADLVAHVGEELALGERRRLGPAAGDFELATIRASRARSTSAFCSAACLRSVTSRAAA